MSGLLVGCRPRAALLLGAASTALLLSAPAGAQNEVETVVVTGSRIPQTGAESSSPVTVVSRQELVLEGATNVENVLNELPSAFADYGLNQSNGSPGIATVNLRDLGCARTLVLIDGKRLMPGDTVVDCPDLNQIPAGLVDRIEVMTGGASAVYGSDAVAGVVNFIMRRDFEGIELDAQDSGAQHDNDNTLARTVAAQGLGGNTPGSVRQAPGSVWDGAITDLTLLMGANSADGQGNVTLYGGYRSVAAVRESQRDFSVCPVGSRPDLPGDPFICTGSSTTAQSGAGGRFDPVTPDFDIGPNLTIGPDGEMRPYQVSDSYNFAPDNYLQRSDQRYMLGAFSHYTVSRAFDVYLSAMVMDDQTAAQVAPSGLFYGTFVNVNCDNPFLGSPADPNSPFSRLCTDAGYEPRDLATALIGRRNVEGGPRQDRLDHTSFRLVVGAKGELGSAWSYDVSGQYGKALFTDDLVRDLSLQRIQRALLVKEVNGIPTCESVIDGTDPACLPWNIFQPNGVTPAATRYLEASGLREGATQEWVASASVTGDLGDWGVRSPWAINPVSAALAAEYRQERLADDVDEESSSGDLAGAGGPKTGADGGFDVGEGSAELRVPLVQNRPWFENLTADAAYRYSSFNLAGAVHSYKYGAEWQPADDFRIRASIERAVRAPNVLELFTLQGVGLAGGVTDLCAGAPPPLSEEQCAHTGVTGQEYGNIPDCPSTNCNALSGGNFALKPERSDTKEFGIVLTPTFLDGLTVTADYFRIRVAGAIGTVPWDTILYQCATTAKPQFCDLIHRGSDGILFGSGGASGYITDINVNTGAFQTSGVDVEANYNADLDGFGLDGVGSLAINFLGTLTQTYQSTPYAGAHTFDCAGLFGITCGTPVPHWRHKLRATWSAPWHFDLSLQWRYTSALRFDGNTTDPTLSSNCTGIPGIPCGDLRDARIGSYSYFDVALNWTLSDGVQIHAGVSNLFDKDPPMLDSNSVGVVASPLGNGNTYAQVYDALGRYVFLGVTLKH